MTAGELSRTVLWSKPTLSEGVKQYQKKHRIKVELKL